MKQAFLSIFLGCLIISSWCESVYAEEMTRMKPSLAQELMTQLEMSPALKTSKNGSSYLIFSSDDYKAILYFFDCNKSGCSSVQLFSSFSVGTIDIDLINSWNANTIFTRAYIKDQQAIIESDLDISGGITLDNFAAFLAFYTNALPNFIEHLQGASSSGNSPDTSHQHNKISSSSDKPQRTISLAIEGVSESDAGCQVTLGAYNLGNQVSGLSVEFQTTDVSVNQKNIRFDFDRINSGQGASQTQIIPDTNCWRVLDMKITRVSGCNSSKCNEQTRMDLGSPLPISQHSQGIEFHGNPNESN